MTKKIKIIVDSSCTINEENCKKYDVLKLPYKINDVEGNLIEDDFDLKQLEVIMTKIDNGSIYKTSLLSNGILENHIIEILKKYDAVIYITSSVDFTGQYKSAIELMKTFKDKCFVINSHGAAAIIEEAIYEIKKNIDKDEISIEEFDKVIRDINSRTITYFAAKNINGLLHSGRIPLPVAKMLKFSKVIPIIKTEEKNKPAGFTKKWNESIDKIIKYIDNNYPVKLNKDNIEKIYILNVLTSKDDLLKMKEKISEYYEFNINKIEIRSVPLPIAVYTLRESYAITMVAKINRNE